MQSEDPCLSPISEISDTGDHHKHNHAPGARRQGSGNLAGGLQNAVKELVAGGRCHQEDSIGIFSLPALPAGRQRVPTWLEISLHRTPARLYPKQPMVGLHQMKLECCNDINQRLHHLLVSPAPKLQGKLLNVIFKGILLELGQLSR